MLPRNSLDICRAVLMPRPVLFSRGLFPRTILSSRGLFRVIFLSPYVLIPRSFPRNFSIALCP
jgi:hypothetical protein